MKTWKTAALALSLVLIAGPGFAQPGNGPGRRIRCQQRFAALDGNRDGRVTLAEFLAAQHPRGRAYAKAMFASRDANKDGVLTAAEFCSGN